MRYNRERGKFVNYIVRRNNLMWINIETDSDNYTRIGGKGTLRPIKLSNQEVVADTGASL